MISVVIDQMRRGLQEKCATFETFDNRLNDFTYAEMQRMWQTEREKREELELQTTPIK